MKYIALDIGNVICNLDFKQFFKEISKLGTHSEKEAESFLFRSQQAHDLGLTFMEHEFANKFTGNTDKINHLLKEWNNTISANPTIIKFLKELMNDNVKIALLSNMGKEHAEIMENIITKDLYNHCIKFFSFEVGARKPTMLYYKTFLDMYPEFKNCIYVDDRKENLDMGTKFGFKSKYFSLDNFGQNDCMKEELTKICLDI